MNKMAVRNCNGHVCKPTTEVDKNSGIY